MSKMEGGGERIGREGSGERHRTEEAEEIRRETGDGAKEEEV